MDHSEEALSGAHASDDAAACRVLVVDDDLHIREAIDTILSNADLEHLSTLADKLEGLLATYRPSVIMLDLSMPTLDGIEALGLLRKHNYPGLVIVMSGGDRDLIETARRVGQSYGLRMALGLPKPFRATEILAAIRSDDAAEPAAAAKSDLGRAFAASEFRFHYQPKYDLRTRALVGFESLVRWQHPSRGLLAPVAFLAQIESAGLRGELARVALKDATARLGEWHALGFAGNLSINVALDDATDPAFLLQLTAAVNAMAAPPSSLTVELLESSAELDLCTAAGALTRVRLLGVGVSIDDFGTQSSSLARLQHLPANELKIDRSFIADLLKFKQDRIIVRSVIALARDLGMSAVAEGIEDQETMNLLLDMGCIYGQGYHLARPLAIEDARLLLPHRAIRASAQS